MGNLWSIIQAHLDKYGVREAAFARKMGSSPQTLNSWKKRGLKQLPDRDLLEAVARETGTPYDVVLDAVLRDIDYKDEPGRGSAVGRTLPSVDIRRPGGPVDFDPAPTSKDDVALAARKGKPAHPKDTFDVEGVDEPGSEYGA